MYEKSRLFIGAVEFFCVLWQDAFKIGLTLDSCATICFLMATGKILFLKRVGVMFLVAKFLIFWNWKVMEKVREHVADSNQFNLRPRQQGNKIWNQSN